MSKRRDPLPRLNIAPNLNSQQPMGGPAQGLYSPALPTSIQQSFHPSFPMNNPLQTPMQSFFTSAPGAPGRPTNHAHQASIQLAAAGILPPNFATPVTSHFPRPSMMLGPGGQPQAPSHPYPNRNRRQLSIGGPPKAVLGGPARKVSPLPGAVGPSVAPSTSTPAPAKTRKIIVNLPKESPVGEDGEPATRPEWARSPLADAVAYEDIPVAPAAIQTAEIYPPDAYRLNLPNSIDVYLPGKLAWDVIKQKEIEEKLEKLGVERGSGSNIPHIHAPHARAASISSPADPALLLFKLNKLQKAQDASSASNSLSVSPQPQFAGPFGLSPSPRAHLFGNRHGHSMSLAQGPSYQPYSSTPSPFNPFGVNAVLGSDSLTESITSDSSFQADPIHAPQGRIPVNFGPPLSGSSSTVDFTRGFGLDVPLESEEEGEEEAQAAVHDHSADEEDSENSDATRDIDLSQRFEQESETSEVDDGMTTVPQSRLHSRHVSKLSAALSLRSVGGNFPSEFQGAAERVERQEEERAAEADQSEEDVEEERPQVPEHDLDPVEEWTGSEDVYLGTETSDDESIGEWSNPSDEERARQQRVERRMRRRARQQDVDQPRRLPNFPRPPASALNFLQRREDDIISNPSEENLTLARRAEFLGMTTEEYYPEPTASRAPQSNPFALPSHSRGASSQYSVHDPAMAHSRHGSDNYAYPISNPNQQHQSTLSAGRRESLNPFAKPFVFGQRPPNSSSWPPTYAAAEPAAPSMPIPAPTGSSSFSPVHARLPSLGKPLNVTAPEFKPGGFNIAAVEFKPGAFNFRLPGAPQMPVAEPAPPPFPVSQHAEPVETSPFKVQGREKRQRRLSSTSSIEEGDSMSSFKFPMKLDTSSPNIHRRRRSRSLSSTNEVEVDLNLATQPFTFAGFSAVANNMPWVPKESDTDATNVEEALNDSSTAKAENSVQADEVVIPAPMKQKRAPIPLDFKHPVSGNTVPAGLFKALISSNEDRTRRSARSRLDSREVFEHSHRPSMDDDNVVLIAQKGPRGRLVTDPGERPMPSASDDVFGSVRHSRRRSSLPDALVDNSPTRASVSPQDLASLHQLETVFGQLLDEKFSELRQQISRREQKSESSALAKAEEVISLFRVQLQESAVRSLEDSRIDARGEFDFQMLKEVVEDGNKELLVSLQHEVHRAIQNLPVPYENKLDIHPVVEELGNKIVSAVVESVSDLSARQEAAARNTPALEHDVIVDKLVAVLSPMIHSLHTEPIDYDFLTRELTQSVKPHISQLIDLTSDKRETAGLFVERILPHLTALKPVPIDTDAITMQLITEVRRAIAPIDAFEIKEQVADLVVERLDSRLAVRDKASNADTIASKVTDSFAPLLETLNKVPATVGELASAQKAADQKQSDLADIQNRILASIAEIQSRVEPQFEQVKTLQRDVLKKLDQPTLTGEPDANILIIKGIVEALSSEQKKLAEKSEGYILESNAISDKLAALPEHFSTIAKGVESSLTELITSRDSTKRELEELRKLNTEYQIQLTKARGSHGQVRVEKDVLAEKLNALEADRDRLRAQTKELQKAASTQATETTALEARNAELEDALAKALARLQSADVVAQANQRSIADLEASDKGLIGEKQELKSKLDSLDQELRFAHTEKETTSKALAGLQAKYDVLASQQSNWEALNAATEKINMVFNLLENADSEEQKELRHYRDHCKLLEEGNTALHKRVKDAESRLANAERSGATLRQTLSQAQQRSEEWERLAKTAQGTVEMLETKLEQAEQTQSQLDADYQFVKIQLDEKEADSRLKQDRETKLQQQITALESKCVRLQTELEKANAMKLNSAAAPFRPRTNGNTVSHPPRPDSRASTIYDGRETPNRRISSYSSARSSVVSPSTGNEPSVWDSMHAPSANTARWTQAPVKTPVSRYSTLAPATPKVHQPSAYAPYPRGPSPTPSTVSAAPTQGDDGWWS